MSFKNRQEFLVCLLYLQLLYPSLQSNWLWDMLSVWNFLHSTFDIDAPFDCDQTAQIRRRLFNRKPSNDGEVLDIFVE